MNHIHEKYNSLLVRPTCSILKYTSNLLNKIPVKAFHYMLNSPFYFIYVLLNVSIHWDLVDLCSRKLKTGETLLLHTAFLLSQLYRHSKDQVQREQTATFHSKLFSETDFSSGIYSFCICFSPPSNN